MARTVGVRKLLTWRVPSSLVDPAKVVFGAPPDCGCQGARDLRVDVLLPRGYDKRRTYPVLYLLHGAGEAYDSWITRPTEANGTLGGDLQRAAKDFPGIVVMPEGGSFGWYTDWWNGGRAGDPAWESYHLRTVIAWVERRLAIRPGRRWHAIAGWSMGGMGALYYASQRPDYFGYAASLSGRIDIQSQAFLDGLAANDQRRTVIWGDPTAQAFYWTGHNPRALTDNLRQTRLFVRVGNGEGAPSAAGSPQALTERELLNEAGSFVAAARSSGADVELQVVPGLHNAFNQRAGLIELFRRLDFRAAQPEPPQWTYKTVTRTGRAWNVRFKFSAQPTTVITFSRQGRRLLVTGNGNVRVTLPSGRSIAGGLPLQIPVAF